MKTILFTAALFLWVSGAVAAPPFPRENAITDEGRAPYRSEFISYDIRSEADAGRTAGSKYFRELTFKPAAIAAGRATDGATGSTTGGFEASIDIPALWLDRNVYIRDTGRTGRYLLRVNGHPAGLNTDSYGTNDYFLTPFLREGTNTLTLEFLPEIQGGDMERFEPGQMRRVLESLYIWSQPRIHIFDWEVSGHYDEEYKDAVIDLALVVANGFNMDEKVTVGFDIYDPAGKLTEVVFKDAVIPGQGSDTVRFYNKIMGTEKFQYSASNSALYRVVLTLKQGGRNIEYIPFRMGFGLTSFDGSTVSRGGVPVVVKATEGDFPVEAGTRERLRALKKQGFNTVSVVRPQQKWFYDMCAQEGMYVIDRAAVECDPRGGDRGPGGTIANAPSYRARFLDRQQAMYYRNRGYPNIIGWAIGSESGNGYNMYASYRLLKSLDPTRPVIYPWAEGEFNSDLQ